MVAAGVGILLAIGGMMNADPFLVLLGSIIPIGGVILADYWFYRGGRYPLLHTARLPRFLTGWGWAPTPWARWWLTCRRGSPRWLALPFPHWSISR